MRGARRIRRAPLSLGLWSTIVALASVKTAGGLEIPRLQAIPLPQQQISFQLDERELARYYFSPDAIRPFVYPVVGPSGRSLTRMGHPGDPHLHSHHNSVWFSFSKIHGVDFWTDRGGGRIRHAYIEQLEDGNENAFALTVGEWLDQGGRVLLRERRYVGVKLLGEKEWMLLLELQLEPATSAPLIVEQGSFGPIGVRMAKWISVHYGGGRIRSSEGAEGEEAIFRRPARWVDYSGPVAAGVIEGITLMDHPANPRHPAPFHVRADGWMGTLLALQEPYVIEPGGRLQLRYGLYVHEGVPAAAKIEGVWKRFASEPLRPPLGPPQSRQDCLHGGFRRYTTPREFKTQRECEEFIRGGK